MSKKGLFKVFFFVPLVLVLALVIPGYCAEKEPFLIGFIEALTGSYAPLGVDAKKAEELAIEEINAAGGANVRKFKGIFYDDESQPPRAADLVRKLKDQGVITIIGGQGLPLGIAASKVANDEKVPFFPKSPASLPLEVGQPGSYVFGPLLYDFNSLLDSLIRFLVKGGPRIGVLLTSDPMGEMYSKMIAGLKEKEPKLFEVVGIEKMLTTDVDITPQLTKLKALKPNALLIGPSGRPATVAFKNLDLMDWNIPAVAFSSNSTLAFINSVKGFSDRVRLTMPAVGLRPDTIPDDDPGNVPALRKIVTQFKKETGRILFDGALTSYDTLHSLVEVINKLKLDPDKQGIQDMRDKIRQALETQSYKGTLVRIQRTPTNHRGASRYRMYEAKIEGDWFVPLRWIEYPTMEQGEIKKK